MDVQGSPSMAFQNAQQGAENAGACQTVTACAFNFLLHPKGQAMQRNLLEKLICGKSAGQRW